MKRTVFRSGNSLVVALPKDALEALGITVGSAVSIAVDTNARHLIIQALHAGDGIESIDIEFARQIADFIDTYRPALTARQSKRQCLSL